jgi:hypothetical protein
MPEVLDYRVSLMAPHAGGRSAILVFFLDVGMRVVAPNHVRLRLDEVAHAMVIAPRPGDGTGGVLMLGLSGPDEVAAREIGSWADRGGR